MQNQPNQLNQQNYYYQQPQGEIKANNIQNQHHPNFNAYQPPQLGSNQNNVGYGFNQPPFYVNNAPLPPIKIKTRISKFDLI